MKIRGQEVFDAEVRIQRLSVIDTKTGCWNWISATRGGYGKLMVGSRTDGTRRSISAHRYSYECFVGSVPEGYEVCHSCDNPRCVNPGHLFTGTRQDNIDDREKKGRNNPPHGEAHPRAKLTVADVLAARVLRQDGKTYASIAKHFGVHKKTIMQAIKGQRWASVPEPPR